MDAWDDKTTGEKRSKIKVQADRVQFLDRRPDPAGGMGDDDSLPAREAAARRGPSAPEGRGPANGPARGYPPPPAAPTPRRPAAEPDPEDDDIPF